MSENALLPGSARVKFDYSDATMMVKYSSSFNQQLLAMKRQDTPLSSTRQKASQWIVDELRDIGLETYEHTFTVTNDTLKEQGHNIYAVIRAPKADGTESIVISTKYMCQYSDINDPTTSIGVVLGLAKNLHQYARVWLSKDIIFVISDGHFGSEGMRAWLADYHNIINTRHTTHFKRAGMIQAALNIEVIPHTQDRIHILVEGSNGQLPNLDLVNTIGRLARKEGKADLVSLAIKDAELAELLPADLRTLGTFMINQAIGVPTGDHGMFNTYHIDAVTLSLTCDRPDSQLRNSRIIIGTLRSLNNLLEHLHQSFYYYLLPSPFAYISIGEYMISLGLILAPLILKVLLLLVQLSNTFKKPFVVVNTVATTQPTPNKESDTPTDILYSVTIVMIAQLVGIALFTLPLTFSDSTFKLLSYLSTLPTIGEGMLFGMFAVLYGQLFLVIYRKIDSFFSSTGTTSKVMGGSGFKVFSCIPALLFISTMSLLNFSFCTLAAIITVPLCVIPHRPGNVFSRLAQLLLNVAVSPPLVIYIFATNYLGQNVFNFIATIIKQYLLYTSLFFPFLTLVYIPLNILTLKLVIGSNNNNNNKQTSIKKDQ
eukprot:gene13903-16403_t